MLNVWIVHSRRAFIQSGTNCASGTRMASSGGSRIAAANRNAIETAYAEFVTLTSTTSTCAAAVSAARIAKSRHGSSGPTRARTAAARTHAAAQTRTKYA